MSEPISSTPMPSEGTTQLQAQLPSSDDPWRTAAKRLNYFVGAVALMERLGNCLGTLVLTWATVVVLGGFSTNLGLDFWYATAIVFLEAFRVFSRESRSDDELLFKTTGSIKLKMMKLSRGITYYLTVSIVIVCMYGTLEFTLRHYGYSPPPHYRLQYHILLLSVLLALASVAQAPIAAAYLKDHAWLQFVSALIAVLALGSAMLWSGTRKREVLLIIPPLLVGCLQTVFREIWGCLGKPCLELVQSKLLSNTLVALILPAWIVISVLLEFSSMGILILLGTLLLGNIQIPVAVARIVISVVRLSSNHSNNDSFLHPGNTNEHLAPALTIFYSMVLAQGVLYCAACILESLFSSHFRWSLAKSCNLTYSEGLEAIDLYYEYAYNKRMQEGVLAQEGMSLVTFAFNYLDSNDKKQLAAVQILHALLQLKGASSNARLVSEITASTKVVASLINMLGWTPASDDQQGTEFSIRWFTVNVVASLAGDLRIVGIPGTMQMVSSLLDVGAKNKVKQRISILSFEKNEANTNDNQQQDHPSSTVVDILEGHGYPASTNGQELSKQVEGGNKRDRSSYFKLKFLRCIKYWFYGPEEEKEPSKNIDLFPILGMQILKMIANDLDNCIEISKATGLIPKVIGFIINTTDTTNSIMTSSLKLIAKLANVKGEMGTSIRQKILDQPLFLINLVEILVDTSSHAKQWKPTMVIMAKIILEDETSKDVERFHVIIPKLMHAFLGPNESSGTNYDHFLRKLAGEALSKLVAESTEKPNICMAILQEKGYALIEDLKEMLRQDKYTYVAASLLSNLCVHCKDMLHHSRPSEKLSSILQVVLEKILNSEGKQLQVLIITALQLHKLIPKKFAYELESCTNKEKFVQKLVAALNSNKKMSNECPSMRRVIVEITISIMESCPHYAPIFTSKRMMEELAKVQRILAEVEKYRAFLGDARVGVFDSGLPPQYLVTKAKQLLGSEISNQEDNVQDSSSLDIVHVN